MQFYNSQVTHWGDFENYDTGTRVLTLQYDTDGEFTVDELYLDRQIRSEVTALADGRIAYVWLNQDREAPVDLVDLPYYGGDGDGDGINAIIRNADGSISVSEFTVNTFTTDYQTAPTITQLANGKIVFVWETSATAEVDGGDGSITAIKAKVFNADGTVFRDEFLVNTEVNSQQSAPQAAALADGGFVITWGTYAHGGQLDVAARIFGADGVATGNEFAIQTNAADEQRVPDVIGLKNGGFAIAWESDAATGDADGKGIAVSVFDKNGNLAVAGEVTANTTTTGAQTDPRITVLADGKFIVTWESASGDTDGLGIFGRLFNADGTTASAEIQFNQGVTGDQEAPVVSAMENGWFIVVWQGDSGDGNQEGIVARVFDENGVAQGDDFVVNDLTSAAQLDPSVSTLPDGKVVVSWTTQAATDTDSFGIQSTVLDIYNQETGDAADNTFNGVAIKDVMDGNGGNDILRGLGGNDVLNGGTGHDTLKGGADRDTLNGGDGNDDLDGGADADTMAGGAGNDTYTIDDAGDTVADSSGTDDVQSANRSLDLGASGINGVENATLTGSAALDLTGDAGNNRLTGNAGKNTIDGGKGADQMAGGGGNDLYKLDNTGDRITDTAGKDTVQSANQSLNLKSFKIKGVENAELTGRASKSLTGDNGKNVLTGNSGKNKIDGKKGNDTLEGGKKSDIFVFKTNYDKEKIVDFDAKGKDHDILDLRKLKSIKNYSDLIDNHIDQKGKHVIIDGGKGDEIKLLKVKLGDLDAGDFLI